MTALLPGFLIRNVREKSGSGLIVVGGTMTLNTALKPQAEDLFKDRQHFKGDRYGLF